MNSNMIINESEFVHIPFHILTEELSSSPVVLEGIAASPGIVEGVCAVLSTFEDFQEIEEGMILIAESAGPALLPIIPNVMGLLTERGGMLAMASRAAREYEIPAVVGIEGLRKKLRSGDRVIVDGLEGKVYLISPAS